MRNYFSMNHITAGFLAVLIGFTSSAAIIFQAVTVMGGTPADSISWLLALTMGVAITCIPLSLYYRMPILTAWSTPGAALLVTSLPGISMSHAVGAFIFAGVLTLITGLSGWFEKMMKIIPRALASAMLAGTLLHFGVNVFVAMQDQHVLVILMLLTYLLGKRFFPRIALVLVFAVGIVSAASENLIHWPDFHLAFAMPIFTWPQFSWPIMLSIGLPLYIITMTSQNIPGLTIMQAAGYEPPTSRLISWMGITTVVMAPFGGFTYNFAAITAALCSSEEADLDPAKRYRATVCAGIFYLILGLMGTAIVAVFTAFPQALVLAIAGLALFGTLANNLKEALDDEKHREPALITFLIAASGVNLFGVSAAFWGLLIGVLSLKLLTPRLKSREVPETV